MCIFRSFSANISKNKVIKELDDLTLLKYDIKTIGKDFDRSLSFDDAKQKTLELTTEICHQKGQHELLRFQTLYPSKMKNVFKHASKIEDTNVRDCFLTGFVDRTKFGVKNFTTSNDYGIKDWLHEDVRKSLKVTYRG